MMQDESLINELIGGFERELRRGSLVLVVLFLLQKPTHGYDLLTRVEKHKVAMDTDTLYPLLRRLESQGLLVGEWKTTAARPRKIYALTTLGIEVLANMKSLWAQYGKTIERMIDHD
jgi:DNA-binding PadR family transcriptional regulator